MVFGYGNVQEIDPVVLFLFKTVLYTGAKLLKSSSTLCMFVLSTLYVTRMSSTYLK